MATILVVEDDQPLAEALADTLALEGFSVLTATDGAGALRLLGQEQVDLVVSDVHMRGMDGHLLLKAIKRQEPELPVLLMTAYGTIQKAVEAMREGAGDYLVKPFEAETLVRAVRKFLRQEDQAEPVAADPRSRELLALAQRVAQSDASVLVLGESGTGKEVIARYIHRHSRRSGGPFVAINCAAIPENMLEATLFGYEKGSFTGAIRAMPGKFEQAQGGTLLLDEISEMDLGLQAKLLRVLQEREVERLGATTPIALDVRLLATSNRDMRGEVQAGRFREDLYYRLNVFPLRMPPLRDRPGDIAPLAERFLARAAPASGRAIPELSEAAKERLVRHSWPGNVRELDNLIQRALILQPGEIIGPDDLHFEQNAPDEAPLATELLSQGVKSREYDLIREALKGGSRREAAERLGISERTLRYKLARLREEGFELPDG